MHTIFAQSTKFGKSGVSIFRISGPKSQLALAKLLANNITDIKPRVMYYKKIYHPVSLRLIDFAMVVFFNTPHSFTGEDIVEIHTHGSIAITKMLLSALSSIDELRFAEPGEFTRRAFFNKKIDLIFVEGLSDLIEAETELQHRQAISQINGELYKIYDTWRSKLLTIISLLECYIDFPDEEIPEEVLNKVILSVEELKSQISFYLNDKRRGELLSDGILLSIIGAPNVGKSTLVNFLSQRDLSIISDTPGTTRDIIEGHIDIGGYPITVRDTAGIRNLEALDPIEQEGIKRAQKAAECSNIKIILTDIHNLDFFDFEKWIDSNTILVINKIDLGNNICDFMINNVKPIKISLLANLGLDILLKEIEKIASNIVGDFESPQIFKQRHKDLLNRVLESLSNFDLNNDLILATEDIRIAIRSLSYITGGITVDEILSTIFKSFCIGK